jgi:hypothetical protein
MTNEERARERLQRARSFLEKAHALMLQDDLVYRSALDDSISAIKNNLQGYLLQKIVSSGGYAPIPWQEAVQGNRMPELLRACAEAGLDLRGLDREIRKLNDERNFRTHDDPLRHVDTAQARQAVDLALLLNRRVQDALKSAGVRPPVPSVSLSSRLPDPVLAKVGIGPVRPAAPQGANGARPAVAASSGSATLSNSSAAVATATPPPHPAVKAAEPAPATPEKRAPEPITEDDEIGQETAEQVAVQGAERRQWMRRFLVRGGAAAALLIAGAASGVGLAVVSGNAFNAHLSAGSQSKINVTATPTLLPGNAYLAAGPVLVSAPACQGGRAVLSLRNTGPTSQSFSLGSPDDHTATFALAPATPGQASLSGALAPNASAVVYVTPGAGATRYTVVVVAQGGAAQVPAAAC